MAGNDLKLQVLLNAVDRVTGPMKKITRGTGDTAKALKAAKDRLQDLEKAQQQLRGFRKLKNEAGESGQALRAAQQQLTRMKAAIEGVERPTRDATRAYNRAEREVTKLKTAHMRQLRVLRDARGELTAAGVQTRKFSEHERQLRTDIQRTNQVIDKQTAKLTRLGKQNQKRYLARRNLANGQAMADSATSSGASLIGAGAMLAVPAAVSVRSYASWEDAMLGVARQVQGARDQAGNLTPLYYQMGDAIQTLSERIPMASTELAALIEQGARMGIQGKKNLLAFAETTAVTATAFDLPVDLVGTNMGKLAGLYKIPIRNISQLGDTINWLDDNAQSSGGDIIDVMQRLGGLADKLDYRRAAALGSTFLTLGASSEVAASAAKAMVRELGIAQMQPKRFQAGLNRLGLDAAEIQRRMATDATGTILMVMDAIKALPKAEQLTVATQLFGKEFGDDASKLANNVGEYRRQLELVNAAQARGSMSREAEARLKNLSAGWQLLKSTAFNTAADLGATLAPALSDMMKLVGGVLRGVRAWVKENPSLAGGLLKISAVLAALLGAVGALVLGAGALLGPLALVKFSLATLGINAGPAVAMMRTLGAKVLPMVGRAIMVVGRALMLNPIGLILTAIGVAAYLIWKNWDKIGPMLSAVWDAVWARLKVVWGAIKTYVLGAWNVIAGIFAGDGDRILGGLAKMWEAINTMLGGWPAKFLQFGIDMIRGLVRGIGSMAGAVKDSVVGAVSGAVDKFKSLLGINSPSRLFAQFGQYTMQGYAGGLDRSARLPLRALGDTTRRMRQLGAGVAIAAAATPVVAIDNRPPLTSTATAPTAAGATYHIHIHAGAGTAAPDIAAAVRAELERIERERAARTRSRLGDYD